MPRSQGDIDKRHASETAIRGIFAFLIHLVLGAAAVAILYFLTRNFEQASEAVRQNVGTAEDAELSVRAYLDEARAYLMAWTILSLACSWIAATLFIAIAQRHDARTDDEARERFVAWGVLLIVAAFVSAFIWWRGVSLHQVSFDLLSGNYFTILAASTAALLLGYYLSTALAVKPVMKLSIPGASVLPSIRK